ncbi:MAG: hypothetical protein P1U36_00525 [Legionellaceae bacterium]|nr:hypothetical protein [Legionellaceae bacterium]
MEQHHALIKINQLLQAISNKNFSAFKDAFNINEPFLDILPGGVRIESALALIECHRDFFNDPRTTFEYLPLIDIIDAGSTLSAASIVKVGLADGSTRQVYLRLLYQRNQQDTWWPRLLQNTWMDTDQKVIG